MKGYMKTENRNVKKKRHLPTAVSRKCGAWDLSELVIFETKFCLYL